MPGAQTAHHSIYNIYSAAVHTTQTAFQYILCRRHFVLGLRRQKSRRSVRRFSEENKKQNKTKITKKNNKEHAQKNFRLSVSESTAIQGSSFRLGVGQNIATRASLAARNFTLQTSTFPVL